MWHRGAVRVSVGVRVRVTGADPTGCPESQETPFRDRRCGLAVLRHMVVLASGRGRASMTSKVGVREANAVACTGPKSAGDAFPLEGRTSPSNSASKIETQSTRLFQLTPHEPTGSLRLDSGFLDIGGGLQPQILSRIGRTPVRRGTSKVFAKAQPDCKTAGGSSSNCVWSEIWRYGRLRSNSSHRKNTRRQE